MQKITPFLWFDNNAEDAVALYTSLFDNSNIVNITRYNEEGAKASGQKPGTAMTIAFKLEGLSFTALNGGPHFKLNPSTSFFVYCESENKINLLYKKLSDGGFILMPLHKYDWSPKYAWVQDKFGLSWQLDIDKINNQQKILPALLFVNEKNLRLKEAAAYYSSVFPDSKIIMEYPYDNSVGVPEGTLLFVQFKLNNFLFNGMSSIMKHDFGFNEAFSFVVNCKDQKEVDYYWNKLTSDGGLESQCAWLKDKFGVSWQIVPTRLIELLADPDPVKAQKVMMAMLQMKKIIIEDLEKAYEN
ncbi:MAG: VOC family protein [Ignavibacterium sp.]|jgi:predicted 3-demethylubiquinone-9 3-methyltransferase (glyoxalase superfamily)|nr:VOC family protein [Ignavibacterium sp.]